MPVGAILDELPVPVATGVADTAVSLPAAANGAGVVRADDAAHDYGPT